MSDIPDKDRQVNVDKAKTQWLNLYSLLTEQALAYLVPPLPKLQDQVYASNWGAVLPHCASKVFLASKFKAEARDGEQHFAKLLLTLLAFEHVDVPYFFEGEAELKWLRDNIYLGGYGQRTAKQALDWISEEYDAKIIKIEERDPYLYHLDCSVLPLASDLVLAYTGGISKETLKEIEKVASIIPVSKRLAYAGATNSLRVGYTLFNATCIQETGPSHPYLTPLKEEQAKNKFLEEVCRNYGLELVFVNLSEMLKSGALLSCCVLHLSHDEVYLAKP